jgi:hypothetical protein
MKKKMKKFAEGGFSAAQEEFLGGADRTDPYILARMRAAVPDEKMKESVVEETSEDLDPYGAASKKPVSVEKTVVKTKVEPAKSKDFKALTNKDEEGNKLPTDVKKPIIAIPKNAAGMQQYRSDAESPVERLFKSMMGSKSQRTAAAEKKMAKGGSVKVSSASKRADGCAQRGKTKGRIV